MNGMKTEVRGLTSIDIWVVMTGLYERDENKFEQVLLKIG